MNLLKKFITYLFKVFCLEKHKFKPSDLIARVGTRTLFEVDTNYYNTNFEPVTIVRAYPLGTQVMGISSHEIKEFKEYKNIPKDGFATTTTDNDKFAVYKAKK